MAEKEENLQGEFVDVYDHTENRWKVAYVEQRNDKRGVRIKYDGEDKSEWLVGSSPRLRPFRTATSCSSADPAVRPWLDLPSELASMREFFADVTDSSFLSVVRPAAFIETVRGKLFFAADFLRQKTNLSLEEQNAVLSIGEWVHSLMSLWLAGVEWTISWAELCETRPEVIYSDSKAALASAFPELFAVLVWLLTSRASLTEALQSISPDNPPQAMREYFFSHLGIADGVFFAKIRTVFAFRSGTRRLPLGILLKLPVWTICENFNLQKTHAEFVDCVRKRTQEFSEAAEKTYSRDVFCSLARFLFSQTRADQTQNERDADLLLGLPLQFLGSESLPKRLEGAALLSALITDKPQDALPWFPPTAFSQFLLRKNVLRRLMADRPNVNVLRKSRQLFLEVARFDYYDSDLLEDIIKSAYDANIDSDFRSVLMTYLLEICEMLPISRLKDVASVLNSKEHSELQVSHLHSFLKSAGRAMESRNRDQFPFFLDEFLTAVLQGNRERIEVLEAKKRCLADCLTSPAYIQLRKGALERTAERLQGGNPLAIRLLAEVLEKSDRCDAELLLAACEGARKRRDMQPTLLSEVCMREVLLRESEAETLKSAFRLLDAIAEVRKDREIVASEDAAKLVSRLFREHDCSEAIVSWLTHTAALKPEQTKFLFEAVIAQLGESSLSVAPLSAFEAFLHFFLRENSHYSRLMLDRESVVCRISVNLSGLETLYAFATRSNSAVIRQQAQTALLRIHTCSSRICARKSLRKMLEFARNQLKSERDPAAGQRIVEMLVAYNDRIEEITTKKRFPSGALRVYYLPSGESDWKIDCLPSDATFGHLRRDLAHLLDLPAETLAVSYKEEAHYSFLHDAMRLKDCRHPLHFQIAAQSDFDYAFIPLAAAGELIYAEIISKLRESASETERRALWTVLRSLATSETVQRTVHEGGRTFFGLIESAFYEQFFCLVSLSYSEETATLRNFLREKAKFALFEMMGRNAIAGGGLAEFLEIYEAEGAAEYSHLLISALRTLEAAFPPDSRQAFVTYVLDLVLTINRRPEVRRLSQSAADLLQLFAASFAGKYDELAQYFAAYRHISPLLYGSVSGEQGGYGQTMAEVWISLAGKSKVMGRLIVEKLIERINEAISLEKCGLAYFELLDRLYPQHQLYDAEAVYKHFMSLLVPPSLERGATSEHRGFAGIFTFLRAAISCREAPVSSSDVSRLMDSLFARSETASTHASAPLCKSYTSRSRAMHLLAYICTRSRQEESIVVAQFVPLLNETAHRGEERKAWGRQLHCGEKRRVMGMKNMGATCYLNAVLQTLYGVKAFRDGLLRGFDGRFPAWVEELQRLFVGLEHSDKSFISTRRFCSAFTNIFGEAIDPGAQQDASEFLETLLNKLTDDFSADPPSLFKGQTVTTTTGLSPCVHRSAHLEHFFCLRLGIENCNSVQAALERLATPETITGENAWGCEVCGKTSAQRSVALSSLPRELLITLNRFQYSHDFGQRLKVSSYCEFPEELEVSRYASESLASVSRYRLKGVIVHRGSAESGHYTAFVHLGEDWLLVDDREATEVDFSTVCKDGFGVSEEQQTMQESERLLVPSAFILLYEAVQDSMEVEHAAVSPTIDAFVRDRQAANAKFWRRRRLFSPELQEFIQSVLSAGTPLGPSLSLRYIFSIGIRTDPLPTAIIRQVFQLITSHADIANWTLLVFTQKPMLAELIITNPLQVNRKIMIGFAVQAYLSAGRSEKVAFVAVLCSIRKKFGLPSARFEGYFELLYQLATAETEMKVAKMLVDTAIRPILAQSTRDVAADCPDVTDAGASIGRETERLPEEFSDEQSPPDFCFLALSMNLAIVISDVKEIAECLRNRDLLMRLVRGCTRRSAANHLFYAVSHCLDTHTGFTNELFGSYVDALKMEATVADRSGVKSALLQLRRLIGKINEASCTQWILTELEGALLDAVTKYVYPGEEVVSFLAKLCSAHTSALNWLRENRDLTMKLAEWRLKYETFSLDNPQNMSLDRTYEGVSYASGFTPKKHISLYIASLASADFSGSPSYDSDEEFEYSSLVEGSLVDICCDAVTYRAELRTHCRAALHMKYVDYGEELWVAADDERLRNVVQ